MILGTIFIERWRSINPYLKFLENNQYPHNKIDLFWVLDTCSDKFKKKLKSWRKKNQDYRRLTLVEIKNQPLDHSDLHFLTMSTYQKRHNIAENFGLLYEIARERDDELLILEDDIVPPPDTIPRLKKMIKRKDCWIAGLPVVIDYEGEFKGVLNIWDIIKNKDKYVIAPIKNQNAKGIISVGASGTTCTLMDREFVRTGFVPQANIDIIGPCGQDINQGYVLKTQYPDKKWLIDMDIIAKHYIEKEAGKVVIV